MPIIYALIMIPVALMSCHNLQRTGVCVANCGNGKKSNCDDVCETLGITYSGSPSQCNAAQLNSGNPCGGSMVCCGCVSGGTKKECEVAFKCYDKCGPGKEGEGFKHRKCFFDCVGKRSTDKVGNDFRKDVVEVYKWCKNDKRGKDAHESKVLKCALKQVKKDACRPYFRMKKPFAWLELPSDLAK